MTQKSSDTKCTTPFCGKKRAKRSRICHKCAKKKWRQKHPEKAVYAALRDNSKRRGKTFTLTFEQFLAEINGTGYMENRGRYADNLSIDRTDHTRGYEEGNIAVMTVSENGKKGNLEKQSKDDCPF